MPARTSLLLRAAAVALSLSLAACDGGDNPLSPGADPSTVSSAPRSVPSAPVGPDFLTAGSGPRILFSSSRSGGWDLYRMGPDGTGVVRMTSFTGLESSPVWSPDNKRIAFSRLRPDANNVLHRDIFLMNADGTNKHWLESQPSSVYIQEPAWSPDGTRLVVVVYLSGIPRLMLMNVGTGAMSFIIGPQGAASGTSPSFHPNGKKIVYVSPDGKNLETVAVDGSTHSVLMTGTAVAEFNTPRYSPDGTRLAYARTVSGNEDLYVKTLAGGTVKRLTSDPNWDYGPTWGPDGSRIAFISFRAGPSQIYVVSSAGGTQTRITHTTTQETDPAWSH
ncbi:MAG: hypothetical protein ACTHM9_04935 [Gemmatimonadales bacterium]